MVDPPENPYSPPRPEEAPEKMCRRRMARRTAMAALGLTVVMGLGAGMVSLLKPAVRAGGPASISWLLNFMMAGLWALLLWGIWRHPRAWCLPAGIFLTVMALFFGSAGGTLRGANGAVLALAWGGPVAVAAVSCLLLRCLR